MSKNAKNRLGNPEVFWLENGPDDQPPPLTNTDVMKTRDLDPKDIMVRAISYSSKQVDRPCPGYDKTFEVQLSCRDPKTSASPSIETHELAPRTLWSWPAGILNGWKPKKMHASRLQVPHNCVINAMKETDSELYKNGHSIVARYRKGPYMLVYFPLEEILKQGGNIYPDVTAVVSDAYILSTPKKYVKALAICKRGLVEP